MENIFELLINEEDMLGGVNAISLVSDPAIESDWVTLSKQKVQLKVLDEEKRLLMGAALIPNKPIFRRNDEGEEYHIFFSSKTIRKASELFLKKGLQNESTLEHEIPLKGNTVVETWIKEDETHDKSVLHGLSVPTGTWLVSMKINDDKVWEMAKKGEVKGFSIEGYFTDTAIKQSKQSTEELYNEIMNLQQTDN
jgi:hypothetical protein